MGRPRKPGASGLSSRPTSVESNISAVCDSNDMPMSSDCSYSADVSSYFSTDYPSSMFSDGSSLVTGETGHESESIEPSCEQQDSSDLSSTSVSNDD